MDEETNRSSLRRTYSAPMLNLLENEQDEKLYSSFDSNRRAPHPTYLSSNVVRSRSQSYVKQHSEASPRRVNQIKNEETANTSEQEVAHESQITSQIQLYRRWGDFTLEDVPKKKNPSSSQNVDQEDATTSFRPSSLQLDNRSSTPSPTCRKVFLTRRSSSPITITGSSSGKRKFVHADDIDSDIDCSTPTKRIMRMSPGSPQDGCHFVFSGAATSNQSFSFVYPSPNATISPLALPNSSPSMMSSSATWSPDSFLNSEKDDNETHDDKIC